MSETCSHLTFLWKQTEVAPKTSLDFFRWQYFERKHQKTTTKYDGEYLQGERATTCSCPTEVISSCRHYITYISSFHASYAQWIWIEMKNNTNVRMHHRMLKENCAIITIYTASDFRMEFLVKHELVQRSKFFWNN